MNDLRLYFENNKRNRIHKWTHYFDIYDRYFSRYRGTDVHLLEIGVYHGGSLQMWKEYFGRKARLFGLDILPVCKEFEEDQITIFIGDQSDKSFLNQLGGRIPRMDIVIDDGGHTMKQQVNTFEALYPLLSPTGIYVCEDLHTSYWSDYGGGYRRQGTFIEYSKNLIDYLHAWHSEEERKLSVSEFTKSTYAIHYYNSIVVIEKRVITRPEHEMTGKSMLPSEPSAPKLTSWQRVLRKIRSIRI